MFDNTQTIITTWDLTHDYINDDLNVDNKPSFECAWCGALSIFGHIDEFDDSYCCACDHNLHDTCMVCGTQMLEIKYGDYWCIDTQLVSLKMCFVCHCMVGLNDVDYDYHVGNWNVVCPKCGHDCQFDDNGDIVNGAQLLLYGDLNVVMDIQQWCDNMFNEHMWTNMHDTCMNNDMHDMVNQYDGLFT